MYKCYTDTNNRNHWDGSIGKKRGKLFRFLVKWIIIFPFVKDLYSWERTTVFPWTYHGETTGTFVSLFFFF